MATISSPRIVPLVRKLRDAGVPPVAAEALGETMEQVVPRTELSEELADSEKRIDGKIDAWEARLNARMDGLDAKIDELEKRLNTKMEAMESRLAARIDAGNQRMMLATAAFIAVGVTVLMF